MTRTRHQSRRAYIKVLPQRDVPSVLLRSLNLMESPSVQPLSLPECVILAVMKWYYDRGVVNVPQKKVEASYNKVMVCVAEIAGASV